MDHASVVSVLERSADLDHHLHGLRQVHPPLPGDDSVEGLAFGVLHHEVEVAVLLGEVVQHDDVRVLESGQGAGLLDEASLQLLLARQLGRQNLNCDFLLCEAVAAEVDHAHAPLAEQLLQGVGPQDLPTDELVRGLVVGHGAATAPAEKRGACVFNATAFAVF